MTMRPTITVALLGTLVLTSCDDHAAVVTTRATTKASATQSLESRRIALVSIPFNVAVPDGWDLRSGPGGKVVLNGKTPDGSEIDVLLATREPIKAESLRAMLAKLTPTTAASAAAADAGLLTRRVADRDGMKIIEETERLGPSDQAADLVPFRWTIQYIIVGNGLNYPLYELNIADLSQVIYEQNQAFLRTILDSLQYDGSSTTASTRP